MSKLIPGNQKHLSLADRQYIETSLNNHVSFKDIARYLCKDPTTISREVRKYRLSEFCSGNGLFYNEKNHCIHRFTCKLVNVCSKILDCGIKCRSCPTCNQTCSRYKREHCRNVDHAPYVCNGCPEFRKRCTIAQKYRYDALFADRKYREQLVNTRSGISMTKRELHKVDALVSPLVEQGQSPYQIVCNHPELDMSVRTLYSYIDKGYLCARNIDLKRKVRFKPRKVHKTQIHNREVFINRTYTDFEALRLDKWVEMDTVHSCKTCKRVLLTFFFTKEKLFLAYILDRCTAGAVRLVFDRLEKRLDIFTFLTLFGTILTDRGSEFSDPDALETSITVTLCGVVRKAVSNRHIRCSGMSCPKVRISASLRSGM